MNTSLKSQLTNNLQFIGQLEENIIHIIAYIIDNCNYTCSYCYNKQPRTLKILNLNELYKICNKFVQSGLKCQLSLIGGEPTLHPGLVDFCKKIYNIKNISIVIYTNGYNINILQKLILYCKFIITFHSQMSNYQHFYNTVLNSLLNEYRHKIQVRIMLEYNNEIDIMNFYEQIKNDFYDADIKLCAIDDNIYSYNCDIQERSQKYEFLIESIFIKHANGQLKHLIADDIYKDPTIESCISFKNWLCNAGYNYLYIHSDGNIYQCQSFFENNMNPISHITNFQMHNLKKHVCILNKCMCCEIMIDKKRIFK